MPVKRKSNGPWSKRIDRIIEALDIRFVDSKKWFGISKTDLLEVLRGDKKPTVEFLLRLAKLEKAYAKELELWKYVEKRRWKLRDKRDWLKTQMEGTTTVDSGARFDGERSSGRSGVGTPEPPAGAY